MSLDPAPWPSDSLGKIRAAALVGVRYRMVIRWQANPDLGADPEYYSVALPSIDVIEDATARPLTRVTATTTDRALFASVPPDAFRDRSARVSVFACYDGAAITTAPQMFDGYVVEVEDTGTLYRITAQSVDATEDAPHYGARLVPDLAGETPSVGLTIASLIPENGDWSNMPLFAQRRDHPTRPPLPNASTYDLLRAMTLDTGDSLSDYAAGLLDCYPNAMALPDREGRGRITVSERITPTIANALDLRAGQGLTLARPTITWGTDDWANVVRLTAEWRDPATGQQRTQTVTRAHDSAKLGLAVTRVADVRRRWRPPGDNINNALAVVDALLRRLYARSWRATVQTKPLLWLRPGDPVRVTDELVGVVASARLTGPGGLMALSIRPY